MTATERATMEAARDALRFLADASETFAGSEPDMPSHRESERVFDSALVDARAALGRLDAALAPARVEWRDCSWGFAADLPDGRYIEIVNVASGVLWNLFAHKMEPESKIGGTADTLDEAKAAALAAAGVR